MYDLSEVSASNGKPKGKFTMKCLSAKIVKTRNNEDMFAVEYMIIGKEFNKFKVYDNFMLQGNGAKYAMPKLAYLMDLLGVSRKLDNLSEWLQKDVDAKIVQDENGRTVIKEYYKASIEQLIEEY